MHSSATRLRLLSRIIVISLVIIVAVIIAIHDHVSGGGGNAATPTATPVLHAPAGIVAPILHSSAFVAVLSVAHAVQAGI